MYDHFIYLTFDCVINCFLDGFQSLLDQRRNLESLQSDGSNKKLSKAAAMGRVSDVKEILEGNRDLVRICLFFLSPYFLFSSFLYFFLSSSFSFFFFLSFLLNQATAACNSHVSEVKLIGSDLFFPSFLLFFFLFFLSPLLLPSFLLSFLLICAKVACNCHVSDIPVACPDELRSLLSFLFFFFSFLLSFLSFFFSFCFFIFPFFFLHLPFFILSS